MYEILLERRAEKDLRKLSSEPFQRIIAKIQSLSENMIGIQKWATTNLGQELHGCSPSDANGEPDDCNGPDK